MRVPKFYGKLFGYGAAVIVIFGGIYFYIAAGSFLKERQDVSFGVTFSGFFARELDLDPRQAFTAVIYDLGARKIRLPVYWSDIEAGRGKFDFTDYDFFLEEAEKAEAKLILAVGRKLPRWPECHIPSWAEKIQNNEFEDLVDSYIRKVVERYRNSPAVVAWQIENEHFHKYGAGCAAEKIKAEYVDRQISLVRALDSRPIMLTDAGKAGTWFTSLRRADILGISMYYQVWNPRYGVWWSTFGPGLFALKRKILEPFFPDKKFIVSELQAEPFGPIPLPDYDILLQKKLMNADRFRETIRRARKAGFAENYLWGVEWWLWLKEKQNDPGLWDEAKKLFKL